MCKAWYCELSLPQDPVLPNGRHDKDAGLSCQLQTTKQLVYASIVRSAFPLQLIGSCWPHSATSGQEVLKLYKVVGGAADEVCSVLDVL